MLQEDYAARARIEQKRCRGERDILVATHNARCAKVSTSKILEQRKLDLEAEVNSQYPDPARIERIKKIIATLEWSLSR